MSKDNFKFNVGDSVRPKEDIVEIGRKIEASYTRLGSLDEMPTFTIKERYYGVGRIWYHMEEKAYEYRYDERVLERAKERNEI